MTFLNEQVNIDELPQVESIQFIRVERNYLYISYLSSAMFFTLLLAAGLVIQSFSGELFSKITLLILIAWPTLILISCFFTFLGFQKKKYAVRQKDIIYRSGLIFHTITTVPFNRIQHVEIKKGIIDDLFGLSRLKVFTAGGSASDLTIPGIIPEESQRIRAFILNNIAIEEEE